MGLADDLRARYDRCRKAEELAYRIVPLMRDIDPGSFLECMKDDETKTEAEQRYVRETYDRIVQGDVPGVVDDLIWAKSICPDGRMDELDDIIGSVKGLEPVPAAESS